MRVGIVYKTVDKCRGKIKSYFINKSHKIDKLRYNNSEIQTRKIYGLARVEQNVQAV